MTVLRTFLPWYRAGLATALTADPPAGAARAPVPATIRLRDGDGSLTVPAELAGPGDVVGLDQREILRTEPFDGAAEVEPSYLPYVEFVSPDLPWRFSPLAPVTEPLANPEHPDEPWQRQRLQPWLMLVVVPADTATLRPAPPGGLPVLGCAAADLPDPADAWAWAHVQVTHEAATPVATALEDPSARVSRLLCGRRLSAGRRFLACLVPAFAAGRRALLPGPDAADPLAPAWTGAGAVELPVYFQWSFTTGTEGSFETLASRLTPWTGPPAGEATAFGGRTISTGAPGWGVHTDPGGTALMYGALRPLGPPEPPPADGDLAAALRAAVSGTRTGSDLRPPIYGQDYRGGTAVVPAGGGDWLAELNTDPRRRLAAGLGAWSVVVHQEELADWAWRQLAGAGAGRPAGADLADAIGSSLSDRHGATTEAPPALLRLGRAGGPLLTGRTPPPDLLAAVAPDGRRRRARSVRAARPSARTAGPADRFAPSFDEPAYTYLRAVAEEWLLPGVGQIPPDSVALLQTNGPFVESFLIGLNHGLARELIWRRFPLDTGATFFARFWAGAALPPVTEWSATDALGSHGQAADQLVLAIRGMLLRRFPTAAVYLARAGAAGEERILPSFRGTIGVDLVFVGFPQTPEQAVAGGWSIVLAEALDHPRFGCDDGESGETPAAWQDLTWSHPHLDGKEHIPVAGPLAGVARPLGAGAPPAVVWGLDAGHVAAALQQPAFQVRVPIHLWLTPLLPTPPLPTPT